MNSANNSGQTRQTNTSTTSQVTENNNNNSPSEPELIQPTVTNEQSNGIAEADDGPLSTSTRRTVSTETAIDGAANRTNNSAGGEDATFHNLHARSHHHGRLTLSRPLPTELFARRSVRPTQLGSTPSEAECKANEPCSICRNGFTSPIKLRCGHIFCSQCIRIWFEHANTCPYCRTKRW